MKIWKLLTQLRRGCLKASSHFRQIEKCVLDLGEGASAAIAEKLFMGGIK